MLGDHRAVGHDAHQRRRATDRDRTAGECGRNAVSIAVEHHEAGAGHPQHALDIAIEGCGDLPQAALLLREAGGDGVFGRNRMFARSEFSAALGQPQVQRLEAGKASGVNSHSRILPTWFST